mgnify:CR=1 FL=1
MGTDYTLAITAVVGLVVLACTQMSLAPEVPLGQCCAFMVLSLLPQYRDRHLQLAAGVV